MERLCLLFCSIAHEDLVSVSKTTFVGTSQCRSILLPEGNGIFKYSFYFPDTKSPASCVYLFPFCCKFFEAWNSLPGVSYAQKLMNGYQFVADNNLATNCNACISSLCRIFALRQCLIGGCRFSNVIPGCAFRQVSVTETSSFPAILPHSVSRWG